nr:MAG TPA: hypothetical protein [Caudoviricetes sp.]
MRLWFSAWRPTGTAGSGFSVRIELYPQEYNPAIRPSCQERIWRFSSHPPDLTERIVTVFLDEKRVYR